MSASFWLVAGAVSAFFSVAAGAFGAHGLAERLEPRLLEVFKTGAQYQMYHALALLALGLWADQNPQYSAAVPGWAFLAGSVVFSGSLYVLAISGIRWLGAITPLGGVLFLVGWIAFAVVAYRAGSA